MRYDVDVGGMSTKEIRDAVDKFVTRMAPGDVCIYHQGFLLQDRVDNPELDALAGRFYEHGCPPDFAASYDDYIDGTGKGRLTQKRIGKRCFQYGFTKNHQIQRSAFW